MAGFLSGLFGKRDRTGEDHYTLRPRQSLIESPGGKEYYKNIMDRMEGRGVGFGDDYASMYSSPIIQNMRGQFKDYTMPELTSELSLTGRRKGSAGFGQIAQAYRQQADQEGDIFSRLQMRNEDQKRDEINDALGRVGDYARQENDLYNQYVDFDYNAEQDRLGHERQNRSDARTQRNNAVYAGADFAASVLGGSGGVAQRQSPNTMASRSGGSMYNLNPGYASNIGYGGSGNSLNNRLMQRNAMLGRVK